MAKISFDFNCTNCPAIFSVKLNKALNGDYRIHCPSCGHIHFRKVHNGVITDTRFGENTESPLLEDIYPMMSSIKEKSDETEKETNTNLSGFMHRLWQDQFCEFNN